MAWTKRYGDIIYEANHDGVRQLGLSKVTSKAAGQAASRVVSAANSLDPKGQYSAKGIGVYAGENNEPRNAAVVEGKWWPGASSAALQRALAAVVAGQSVQGKVKYTRKDGKTIMVTPAQKANWERMRKGQ